MQEAPRYTLLEIQQMLSQYLDGLLEPDQVQEVEGLLSRFPQYVEELSKLKIARNALKTTLQNPGSDIVVQESVWQSIAERLKNDQEMGLRIFDPEFVSAYYDGEIPAMDSEFIEFESQLFHNARANEILAQMGEVSELIRQWGYRLESTCSVDFSQSVMLRFLAESGRDALMTGSPDVLVQEPPPDAVLLSAYADQALTPRETIAVNRLIESDTKARLTLMHFNRLSEWMQAVSEQLQAQAPDFWPSVSQTLSRSLEAGGLVVAVDRFKTLRRWAKIAGPIAASILLVAIFFPARPPVAPSSALSAQSLPVAAVVTSRQSDVYSGTLIETPNQTEIASVPARNLNSRKLDLAFAGSRAESDVLINVGNSTSDGPLREAGAALRQLPRRSPLSPRLASRPAPNTPVVVSESRQLSPSSEEYLFSALNEQMPDEDISSMFGK
jgi:anti-sigma factor RsiW